MSTNTIASTRSVCFDDVYRGKRVLVTGHTGFKGSWLTYWLERLGATVFGLSLPPETAPNHFDLLPFSNDRSAWVDIRQADQVRSALDAFRPDLVFHLAAQSLVRRSYRQPTDTFGTNVMGTLHVLEAVAATSSVRGVVCVTSDKVYMNAESRAGYVEEDRLGGHDPYSASKACSELVVESFRSSFLPIRSFGQTHRCLVASARAGNVIGGGDWCEDRLIPDAARAVAQGQPIVVRNPRAVRPWQHVLEPLSGYLRLGQRLWEGEVAAAQAWNFGPEGDDEISVEEVLSEVARHWPELRIEIEGSVGTFHETHFLKVVSTKPANICNGRRFGIGGKRSPRPLPGIVTFIPHKQSTRAMTWKVTVRMRSTNKRIGLPHDFHATPFSDAWLIEPTLVSDERGWFMRTYCREKFAARGLVTDFAQANHSHCVHAGTLRGLHYQVPPAAEVKLVRCVRGVVFDVIVDMRRGSPTFLQWYAHTLSSVNRLILYVPAGFAHGYQAIEPSSEIAYQASTFYAPQHERQLRFDDPRVDIQWPIPHPILSPKDDATPLLATTSRESICDNGLTSMKTAIVTGGTGFLVAI